MGRARRTGMLETVRMLFIGVPFGSAVAGA
jgi:hypothetical protein